jgi:hypothetical protein
VQQVDLADILFVVNSFLTVVAALDTVATLISLVATDGKWVDVVGTIVTCLPAAQQHLVEK